MSSKPRCKDSILTYTRTHSIVPNKFYKSKAQCFSIVEYPLVLHEFVVTALLRLPSTPKSLNLSIPLNIKLHSIEFYQKRSFLVSINLRSRNRISYAVLSTITDLMFAATQAINRGDKPDRAISEF